MMMRWFNKGKTLNTPIWEYEPQNAMSLDIVQPYGKSTMEAYYVWNGYPVAMRCEQLTLIVECTQLSGIESVRCTMIQPFMYDKVHFGMEWPAHYKKLRNVSALENFVRDCTSRSLAQWYGIDMRSYSLSHLKYAGNAMLRGYRIAIEMAKQCSK